MKKIKRKKQEKETYNNATLPALLIPNHVPPAMISIPDRTSPLRDDGSDVVDVEA